MSDDLKLKISKAGLRMLPAQPSSGIVAYQIGDLSSKKLVIQNPPSGNKIEIEFETGTIKLEGTWDDNAKNFIAMVERMMRGGYGA